MIINFCSGLLSKLIFFSKFSSVIIFDFTIPQQDPGEVDKIGVNFVIKVFSTFFK